jgi:acid phosphatase
MSPFRLLLIATLTTTLGACASATPRPDPRSASDTPAAGATPVGADARVPGEARDMLFAIAWMQSAIEFEATTRSVFSAARQRLGAIVTAHQLANAADTEAGERTRAQNQLAIWNAMALGERLGDDAGQPLAIVVDVDETMLDNSAYQARLLRADAEYADPSWFAWSEERAATPIPGALEFAQWAAGNAITIFYITNRKAPLCAATADNLRTQGFPVRADGSNVMCRDDARGWTRDKGSRRIAVDREAHVIATFGDNLGDFLDGIYVDVTARQRLAATYRDWWGNRWYMLPNPMYGSWVDAIVQHCEGAVGKRACLERALRER